MTVYIDYDYTSMAFLRRKSSSEFQGGGGGTESMRESEKDLKIGELCCGDDDI